MYINDYIFSKRIQRLKNLQNLNLFIPKYLRSAQQNKNSDQKIHKTKICKVRATCILNFKQLNMLD